MSPWAAQLLNTGLVINVESCYFCSSRLSSRPLLILFFQSAFLKFFLQLVSSLLDATALVWTDIIITVIIIIQIRAK